MGGGITLRIMVTTADVKAGVIWAGTVASYADLFERRWEGGGGGDSSLPAMDPEGGRWRWLPEMLAAYGSPEDNPAFYAAIAPNSYLRTRLDRSNSTMGRLTPRFRLSTHVVHS